MAQPSYKQFCAVARALDLVGERWTLLIVRELLLGGRRYSDLLGGLAGVSPNVLAERLKKLEEAGVVAKRKLPPPAASTVYELTDLGVNLSPVLTELLRWGLNFMDGRHEGEAVNPDHVLMALRLVADAHATVGIRESYEFHVEGHTLHVVADDGAVSIAAGPARDPVAVFTTDFETLVAIGAGRLATRRAVAEGKLTQQGDAEAVVRAGRILNPAARHRASARAAFAEAGADAPEHIWPSVPARA